VSAVVHDRFLVTGAAGFVGGHLRALLLAETDAEIVALARSGDGPIAAHERVRVVRLDLRDADAVNDVVVQEQPTGVFHLAAQSSTADSFAFPTETLVNNMLAQTNLLDALVSLARPPRTLVVCSADEYGLLRDPNRPIDELVELRPTSPYAVSKVMQDMLAFQYFASRGLPTIRVRSFSHTGPGHDERFVVPALARQIAEIERGLRPPVVRVGNLDVRRDFSDVRDVVRAYLLALVAAEPGEVYNVGSGRALSIRELLEMLAAASGVNFRVEVDPALVRPVEVPRQVCDASKLSGLTGWRPRIPIAQTLTDTLDFWRHQVGALSSSGGHV
jgi:GDP-4-dehydro-6-deoxy-D-mannose reductase